MIYCTKKGKCIVQIEILGLTEIYKIRYIKPNNNSIMLNQSLTDGNWHVYMEYVLYTNTTQYSDLQHIYKYIYTYIYIYTFI